MKKHAEEVDTQKKQCNSEVVKKRTMTTNKETEKKQLEESQFTSNVKAVHKWRNSHDGAWPSASSNDAHETFLANFLHHQRTKLCKQELSEKRMTQL